MEEMPRDKNMCNRDANPFSTCDNVLMSAKKIHSVSHTTETNTNGILHLSFRNEIINVKLCILANNVL